MCLGAADLKNQEAGSSGLSEWFLCLVTSSPTVTLSRYHSRYNRAMIATVSLVTFLLE
jgi:hypothetical protein